MLFAVFMAGCKKHAGPGGKNTIRGTVVYKNGVTGTNDVAPMATVYIAYATKEPVSDFDQSILTESDGTFKFTGLNKGNYFVKAEYTDVHGFKYVTNGYAITIENKKKEIEVNITLQ